jgi:hypothetical protein
VQQSEQITDPQSAQFARAGLSQGDPTSLSLGAKIIWQLGIFQLTS